MSEAMYEDPLQNVREHCRQCKKLAEFIQKLKANNCDNCDLGELRKKCARCKTPVGGIFKADIAIALIHPEIFRNPLKGKGRVCTIPDFIQRKIKERHDNGETQQEIADSIGCSRSQVQRVLKRLNNKP